MKIADLLESWLIGLEAERKSPKTVEGYQASVEQFTAWLEAEGRSTDVDDVTADDVRGWLRHLGQVRAESTVLVRYAGLRQFFSWCLAEREVERSPMEAVKPPKVHPKVTPMLEAEQVLALLADAERGQTFADVRDLAAMLLLGDTGCRRAEVTNLRLDDVDLRRREVHVVGKGERPRTVPFGARAARALDRYMRARKRLGGPAAESQWLWLGSTGKGRLSANGLYQAIRRRADRLGLHLHPHMFRHQFADAWLTAGGSESDLMELAGWQSRQMLGRYGAARRSARAREAYQGRSPMDLLTDNDRKRA